MFIPVLLTSAPNTTLGNVIVASGAFVILVVLIRLFAWKAITGIFEQRAKKIGDDIDSAEEAVKKADELLKQRESELSGSKAEAAGIIQTANDTASQNLDKAVANANAEVVAIKERANAEIEQERKEALSSVKGEVADISVQIAEKLIGKSLDVKSQSELIDSYLSKLGD